MTNCRDSNPVTLYFGISNDITVSSDVAITLCWIHYCTTANEEHSWETPSKAVNSKQK